MIKLSIIIPYYNSEKWIDTCLNSLLDQDIDESEYEIIVVDDGSTHSLEVLMGYVNSHSNIIYVKQKNARQSSARNKGLSMAKGEYVFFCDSDDFICVNVIGKIYNIAKENNSDVIKYLCIHYTIGETIKHPSLDWESSKTYQSGMDYLLAAKSVKGGPWDFFAKRSFLEDNQIKFDENMMMREDNKFFLTMILAAKRVTVLAVPIYYYVQNSSSVVHLLGKKENNKQYVDNIISYIDYLKTTLTNIKKAGRSSTHLENSILRTINHDAFVILHNTIRYGSFSRNKDIVDCLKRLDVYPIALIAPEYKKLIFCMNKPSLWLLLCFGISIIPKSIKEYFL